MNLQPYCSGMDLGIARQVFIRDVEDADGDDDTDEWLDNYWELRCVTYDDMGLDPWEVWAGVDVTSGGIGSELTGTEEVPIWTGYENGFWLEGDTEAYDSDSSIDTAYTGFEATVEVRAWPSEVTIDTGDDGPLSGTNDTSSYTLETDEFGEVVTGSEEDPLFTHMFETKGTDAGHECACFLAEVDAVWSGEYRWAMGGLTTGWEDFDYAVEAEPTLVALQVWEVVSRLR
ncbi:MAG: hypothetical protein GEU79_17855 [Acidimicrobiia bacterium]|nr:hypothetical protein [Acidimicrobiia bacterium]